MNIRFLKKTVTALALTLGVAGGAHAGCVDNVVLVHGNSGSSSDWNNTYNKLISKGYSSSEIFRPNWGSRSCFGSCNNHSGSEETPVKNAINDAINSSCTGKIDVIGHSMGVTLAAQQIIKAGKVSKVDSFVGIAGAYRGLYSCGIYPANVASATCGSNGLSISSPFLDWLYGKKIASRVYSIKSWADQIVCSTGTCLVYGKHSSQIQGERSSYSYGYGHFGLQKYTSSKQYDLIK
ncbi:MAG: alpha/beta fold hydrolase [Cellvibrionaceae bacterium]